VRVQNAGQRRRTRRDALGVFFDAVLKRISGCE
jgi:hypothetical protein